MIQNAIFRETLQVEKLIHVPKLGTPRVTFEEIGGGGAIQICRVIR
jgi:hypothetical protein